MDTSISGAWWAIALRGLAAVVLGIACFVLTGIALVALIALFAAYLLVDGAFALVAGLRSRSWFLGVEGVLGLVAGSIGLIYPRVTALVLALLIAGWALITGLLEIGAAISLRRVIRNEWILALSGVLSIVFAVMMAIFPGAGLVAIVWIIGGYGIVFGGLLLGLAFRLRGAQARRIVAPS